MRMMMIHSSTKDTKQKWLARPKTVGKRSRSSRRNTVLQRCGEMKYRIEYVKKPIGKDGKGNVYVGMNAQAARELHVPFNHKKPTHTIVVYKNQSKTERLKTILHEKVEEKNMRVNGYHYRHAHRIATKAERSIK